MRVIFTCVTVLALSGVPASAASLQPPQTVGARPVLATAAAAGGAGSFAFVARQNDGLLGAVRRRASLSWETRELAMRADYQLRDPQIVIDDRGVVTALWAGRVPHPALFAARAQAGSGFGAPRIVARLNDASGARPRMIVLPSRQVLVVFADRASGARSPMRLKTLLITEGRPSVVRDLGAEGSSPAIARSGAGAILAYVAGALRCARGGCVPRPVRATLLDAGGRGTGATVTVSANGVAWHSPPRVVGAGSRAVVSWVSSDGPAIVNHAFTREYRTRPLRARAARKPFPSSRGFGAPTLAVLPGGDLLGANVDRDGQAELTVALRGASWQPPTILGEAGGSTTRPLLETSRGGRALVVFARPRGIGLGPTFDITAVERSPTGAITSTAIGTSLSTNSGSRLSMSVSPDDQAIVTWPGATGGVDVVLRD